MAVSRRLRFEILRRDGHTCRYCGAKAPDVQLTVDHVVPIALGGGDDPSNLVTACQGCNAGKSSMPADAAMVEDVDATAMMFSWAIERAAERRREAIIDLRLDLDEFREMWLSWKYGPQDDRKTVPLDDSWADSVERFMASGLNLEDLRHLIEVAMRSKAVLSEKWRYFCGCCWRTITEIQEDARRIIEDQARLEANGGDPEPYPLDGA